MFCIQCGAQVIEGARFCHQCGFDLSQISGVSEKEPAQQSAPEPSDTAPSGPSKPQLIFPIQSGEVWGFCNAEGEVIVQPAYQPPSRFERFTRNGESADLINIRINRDQVGYLDKAGNEVLPCKYYRIEQKLDNWQKPSGLFYLSSEQGMELFDPVSGKVVTDKAYQYIESFHFGLTILKDEHSAFLFHEDRLEKSKDEFEKVGPLNHLFHKNTSAPLKTTNGQFIYYKRNGEPLNGDYFEDAREFENGYAAVKRNGLYGFIDEEGKQAIPFQYRNAGIFSEGLFVVINDQDKHGAVDIFNNQVIAFKYDIMGEMKEGLMAVSKKRTFTYIDRTGKEITDKYINWANEFIGGLAVVTKPVGFKLIDKDALMDRQGNVLTKFAYQSIEHWIGQTWTLEADGKYGLFTKNKVVIPCKYDEITIIDDRYVIATINEQSSLFNLEGEYILKGPYNFIRVLAPLINTKNHRGFQLFKMDHGLLIDGYHDQFDLDGSFTKLNLVGAQKGGKWGLYDLNGNKVIDYLYDQINHKYGQVFQLVINMADDQYIYKLWDAGSLEIIEEIECSNFYGYNTNGIVVFDRHELSAVYSIQDRRYLTRFEFEISYLYDITEDPIAVKKDSLAGLVDPDFNILITPQYDSLDYYQDGWSYVTKDGQQGYVHIDGTEFWIS